MPDAVFQVRLTVEPRPHGNAVLVPPDALADVAFSYIAVKEGGEEAIIQLSATTEVMRTLERRKDVTRLTPKQRDQLRAAYPAPRIKNQFRMRKRTSDPNETGSALRDFEVDSGGNRIVDTFQTVRSGFYLIDVPIVGEEIGAARTAAVPEKKASRRERL
jgi:hypothetical protein